MPFLADVTFMEVCMALIAIGLAERVLCHLPETMVGPKGWLVTTK